MSDRTSNHGDRRRPDSRIKPPVDEKRLGALWAAAFGPDGGAALSELCSLAKDARVQRILNAKVERAQLRGLLASDVPKVRKNAARLIGALFTENDLPALKDALFSEQTRFVVPSIVLAMGSAGEAALGVLKQYEAELGEPCDVSEEKHFAELRAALSAAMSRCGTRQERAFAGFKSRKAVVLVPPLGCEGLLRNEAAEKGIPLSGLRADTDDYVSLFKLLCFEEALIPLGVAPSPDFAGKDALRRWAEAVAAASCGFPELLSEALSGEMPVNYRIELRTGMKERVDMIRALSTAMDARYKGRLLNSPSNYDAELRVATGERTSVFAKLYVPKDARFAYRKRAVSASIDPVVAACIMRFALPYIKEGGRVLDPCCGSGTLLAERARLAKASELLGVDTDKNAIDAARVNLMEARLTADFIRADATRFTPKKPFDELYSNLPFGTRVGTAESASELYAQIAKRMDTLLTRDGVAVFYTTQRRLLNACMEKTPWREVASTRMEAGGLEPWAMAFKRK